MNKLIWSDNSSALYKKGQGRLYLLRRLRFCRTEIKVKKGNSVLRCPFNAMEVMSERQMMVDGRNFPQHGMAQ